MLRHVGVLVLITVLLLGSVSVASPQIDLIATTISGIVNIGLPIAGCVHQAASVRPDSSPLQAPDQSLSRQGQTQHPSEQPADWRRLPHLTREEIAQHLKTEHPNDPGYQPSQEDIEYVIIWREKVAHIK